MHFGAATGPGASASLFRSWRQQFPAFARWFLLSRICVFFPPPLGFYYLLFQLRRKISFKLCSPPPSPSGLLSFVVAGNSKWYPFLRLQSRCCFLRNYYQGSIAWKSAVSAWGEQIASSSSPRFFRLSHFLHHSWYLPFRLRPLEVREMMTRSITVLIADGSLQQRSQDEFSSAVSWNLSGCLVQEAHESWWSQ
jgi:hypothetical protein